MSLLDKKAIDFLEKYLNNASPTGYESNGQKIWMKYLEPYVDTFITDTYGTAVGVINPDAKFKVVIEGHSDEISWYVNFITDDGLIYVIRNGGRDHHPKCFSMMMAGGGVKGGHVHGATDDFCYNVTKDPVHVHDLNATIMHLMGVDHEEFTFDFQGRDYRLTDVHGRVVEQIIS